MSSVHVHAIADPALGNTAYVVDVGHGLGVVIDPRRDVDGYLEVLDRHGLELAAVFETHLHADFVTGSRELEARTNSAIVAPSAARLAGHHVGMAGGDDGTFGAVRIRALATPGHTPEHLAYVLIDGDTPVGVFTGGSLIEGGAARTDLISPARTEELARAQFQSLRALAAFPGSTLVWPTHGPGSFCTAGQATARAVTLEDHRRTNPLLAMDDEDAFVQGLLAGFGSFPPYFLRLREVNRLGPRLGSDLHVPRPLGADEVAELVATGAWLVDARPVEEWASGHPRGAVSIELRDAFASWLGWVLPFDAPIVALVDEDRRDELVTLARRVGYDRVIGWLDGGIEAWRRAGRPADTTETVDADTAHDRFARDAVLLDVRQRSEWDSEHITGAQHLELGDIIAGKIPHDLRDVVTYCGHGERSATAASLLERAGIGAANLVGGIAAWKAAGYPVSG